MTYDSRVGYNKNYGGYRGRPTEETKKKLRENNIWNDKGRCEETRKKLSEARKGEKHPLYGKHHTEETKKKISENNIWNDKERCEEARKKLSENHANVKGENHPMYGRTGKDNPNSKPIVQIDLNTNEVINTYFGANEAARQTGFKQSSISACCNGRLKTNKGFKWMYLSDYEDGKLPSETPKKEVPGKSVVQIDINTNEVIKVWQSGKEAERIGGFDQSNISACCRGKLKTHKGYKWMFLEDYNKLNN